MLDSSSEGRLIGEPGAEHFVVGIAEAKTKGHAVDTSLVQSFRTCQQHATDLVERVVLATAVAQDRTYLWGGPRVNKRKQCRRAPGHHRLGSTATPGG